ncbi:hypothetical protein J1605_009329 [Eschrichtius robustus]|uniref:Uncharacterized protein n=1 Tax=Eschrichtius robustus TaxID=9764 RepID=A0AB34GWV4_ESCRO|nr:hypothetical protein J1605_009329 [Eschrichtius robustus]
MGLPVWTEPGFLRDSWWFALWSVVVYSVVPGGLLCNPCWFAMYFQLDPPLWFPLVYSVPPGGFPASPGSDLSLSEGVQPPSQPGSSCRPPPNAPPIFALTHFLPGEKPPPYAP